MYSCYSSSISSADQILKIIIWNMLPIGTRREKKNLTKKKMSIDLKRSRSMEEKKITRNVHCCQRIATVFHSHTAGYRNQFFFSAIDMHWFLGPSTTFRWCFYLWIAFIVRSTNSVIQILYIFLPSRSSFFNAKYSFHDQTDIRIHWNNTHICILKENMPKAEKKVFGYEK